MQYITRPTSMGFAFVEAAKRSIISAGVSVEQAVRTPTVPWIARRILTAQGKVGLISEPSTRVS